MMDSVIINILPKRVFDFTYLANSASKEIVIQPAIETVSYYRVRLIVRVHSLKINTGVGQTIYFLLQNTLPSEEDTADFTDTASSFLSVPITTTSPNVTSGTATDPHAFLKIVVQGAQGSTSGGVALNAELSAVLVLRPF